MSEDWVLVVGVGSPDAGDDAVGPLVVDAVGRLGLDGVEVLAHEDPTGLPLLWRGHARVIVVDAVRSGAPAGTLVGLDAVQPGAEPPPSGRAAGTHDFGLATAIGLSRALGTLPERLDIVGVEGIAFTPGDPLTPAVAAAIPDAVAAVRRLAGTGVDG